MGSDPDYRFSLDNERTIVAWIRTESALLAGALVLHQLRGVLQLGRANGWIAACLALMAALLGANAYMRWRRNEIAMRHGLPLPPSRLGLTLAACVALVCIEAAVAMLLDGGI